MLIAWIDNQPNKTQKKTKNRAPSTLDIIHTCIAGGGGRAQKEGDVKMKAVRMGVRDVCDVMCDVRV